MKTTNYDYTPKFEGMRKNARASGYRLVTAIPEFVDNSIAKNATKIRITMVTDNDDKTRLGGVAVIDNGTGMVKDKLHMSFAMAQVIDRDDHDIGSYHMGMKTAAMSIGDRLTILSRSAGENIVGIHADFKMMAENNTFKPTDHSDDVTEDWAIKFMPRDIYNSFIENSTGTLIYTSSLLPNARQPYCGVYEEVKKSMGNCYSSQKLHAGASPFVITVECANGFDTIRPTELFYDSDESKLAHDSYNTTLHVYRDGDHKVTVIEENTVSRKLNRSKQLTHGTPENPKYYEYVVKDGKRTTCNAALVNKDSLPPQANLLGSMKMRVIQVKDEFYNQEDVNFTEDDPLHNDRKGYYFVRGNIRNVASGFRIGFKIHDRAGDGSGERQRVRIEFPSSCDELVGCKYNKQMQDQTLPCIVLGHAIRNISASVFTMWGVESASTSTTPETQSLNSDHAPRDEPVPDDVLHVVEHEEPRIEAIEETPQTVDIPPIVSRRSVYIQSLVDDIADKEFLSQDEKNSIAEFLRVYM